MIEESRIINLDDIRHGVRVANLSMEIAEEIRYQEKRKLYISALFHDIGKAYVDYQVINKPGKLNKEERRIVEDHVLYSASEVIKMGFSDDISEIIKNHHENFDGTGYPYKVKGNSIPVEARIIRICDVYDALTNDRIYREKYSNMDAINIMKNEEKNYDKDILKVFMKLQSTLEFEHDYKSLQKTQ